MRNGGTGGRKVHRLGGRRKVCLRRRRKALKRKRPFLRRKKVSIGTRKVGVVIVVGLALVGMRRRRRTERTKIWLGTRRALERR